MKRLKANGYLIETQECRGGYGWHGGGWRVGGCFTPPSCRIACERRVTR